MEVSGQLHAPTALSSRKEAPVPIGQEAGWDPEPFRTRERREKIPLFLLPGIEPRSPRSLF
jgi:hypothetical protein